MAPRWQQASLVALAIALSLGSGDLAANELIVSRGVLVRHHLLTGELVAEDAVRLVAPNANIWPVTIRWLAEDGTEVDAGDTIVEFDNSQLASSLEDLERQLIETENELESQEANSLNEQLEASFRLEQTRAELEKARLDAAVPANLLARKEYEERQLALERAELQHAEAISSFELKQASGRSQIANQEVNLAKARNAVSRAREGLELLTLTAPRAGVLLVAEHHDEGRPYQTGDSTWPGLTVATLPQLSSMIVEAQLLDVDEGQIEIGMPVTAIVDAFPETTLDGKVISIDNIAQQVSRRSLRRTFKTRIRLEGLDPERMRPGMSVQVVVENRIDDALLVPRATIEWTPTEPAAAPGVQLADGSRVSVGVVACNSDRCAVSASLEVGAVLRRAGDRER